MDKPRFFARNRRWILPTLIIVGAILFTVLLAATRSAPPQEPEDLSGAPVEVQAIELRPLQLTVHSQGIVEPKYKTELIAQVSGELVGINAAFVRGGIVQEGQVLATIDPTNYEVRLEEARAALASAEAALELEQAQSQVARLEWEKVNDTPAPALGLRKPQLAQAEAQVVAARAALKQAQKDLSRTRITAPYDALVEARDVSLGSFVSVGSRLGQLLDIGTAEVRLPLASSELQFLAEDGLGADVVLSSGEHLQWQAKIVRSEGVIDRDTRMTYLVAEVTDPYRLSTASTAGSTGEGNTLQFGSFVVADISGIRLPAAARIPRYLVKDGQVALAQDGKLVFKPVKVLRSIGGYSIVMEGLDAGDQLIATAIDYPTEGMALEIQTKPADVAPATATPAATSADEAAPQSLAQASGKGTP